MSKNRLNRIKRKKEIATGIDSTYMQNIILKNVNLLFK